MTTITMKSIPLPGFLFIALAGLPGLAAPDLQQPPTPLPEQFPVLHTLTAGSEGKPIASAKEWQQERARLKKQWQAVLGEFPAAKLPLDSMILSTEVLDDFTRSFVKYRVEDGVYTDGCCRSVS